MQGAQVRNHALGPARCSGTLCAAFNTNKSFYGLRAEGYRIILLNSNPVSAHMWIRQALQLSYAGVSARLAKRYTFVLRT